MASSASVALDGPVAARWLVALALSTALHGGLVWKAVTFRWPRAVWTRIERAFQFPFR